jgi:hypothetical protein
MRAAGLISLSVAVVLGITAIGSYLDDSKRRDRVLDQMSLLPADPPMESSSFGIGRRDAMRTSCLEEIARLDANMRNDKILEAIAAVLLIGSLAMLSRSASDSENPHGHGFP